jgi:hypothetical protein
MTEHLLYLLRCHTDRVLFQTCGLLLPRKLLFYDFCRTGPPDTATAHLGEFNQPSMTYLPVANLLECIYRCLGYRYQIFY